MRRAIVPTGKRTCQNPALASIQRALAEREERQAYPEAVDGQALQRRGQAG